MQSSILYNGYASKRNKKSVRICGFLLIVCNEREKCFMICISLVFGVSGKVTRYVKKGKLVVLRGRRGRCRHRRRRTKRIKGEFVIR